MHTQTAADSERSLRRHATRMLLVDDHPVMRQGVKGILVSEFEGVEIGEAEDAEQAMEQLRARDWTVVILDLAIPGVRGLDLLRAIRRERPRVPILVLSMFTEEQFPRQSLAAGASGYLSKSTGPRDMVDALQAVMRGESYVNTGPSGGMIGRYADVTYQPHETLSDREYQVLRMIAQGKTVSQIAAEISLSVKTVSTYRARVLDKMGMRTTAELMRYAIMNRLVD